MLAKEIIDRYEAIMAECLEGTITEPQTVDLMVALGIDRAEAEGYIAERKHGDVVEIDPSEDNPE